MITLFLTFLVNVVGYGIYEDLGSAIFYGGFMLGVVVILMGITGTYHYASRAFIISIFSICAMAVFIMATDFFQLYPWLLVLHGVTVFLGGQFS